MVFLFDEYHQVQHSALDRNIYYTTLVLMVYMCILVSMLVKHTTIEMVIKTSLCSFLKLGKF